MECAVFPSLGRPLVHLKISFVLEVEWHFLLQHRDQALATPHPSCKTSAILQRQNAISGVVPSFRIGEVGLTEGGFRKSERLILRQV